MRETIRYTDLSSEEVFQLVMWMLDPKAIDGAVRSAIHAHGPITFGGQKIITVAPVAHQTSTYPKLTIRNAVRGLLGLPIPIKDCISVATPNFFRNEITTCGSSSASKRIRGALKTRVDEYFKNRQNMITPPKSVVQ